ncbi:uncharacterized protein LOC105019373 [Esox lucius]|uniref:Retinoic acid receptor responder protein 2 n=1 Tax=Esox lucius TaxID=8010 RepID=A0AAY5KEM8_ESOLU|nr:uncharacterized protein LOC105019373 [Esox lucius]
MAALLLLFLVSVGVMLSSTEAQKAYNKLPENYRKGVDLALQQLNSHSAVQQHFLFFESIQKSDIESGFNVQYIYHNFYLKSTECAKGTVTPSPQLCPFKNDRPLLDCAVIYKTFGGEIEYDPKPYIDCFQKPKLTEAVKSARLEHFRKMSLPSGTHTLLSVIQHHTDKRRMTE